MMNRWKLSALFALGVAIGTFAAAPSVIADTTAYNAASVCVWNPAYALQPTFEGWIENHQATGVEHRVSCGLIITNDVLATTTDDVTVYFYDNNGGTDMEDNVYCNVYSCDANGNNCANEGTLYGNGTGGTSTPGSNYTGQGYINFTNLAKPAWGVPNVTCAIPLDGGTGWPLIEGMIMYH